ncbi:MAG: hypothetical protein DRJ03_26350 [Chloroflexi bacterium]|nr:MAG: hypothetical protein DRJ03_26350 [Chloroflexota bacterium]
MSYKLQLIQDGVVKYEIAEGERKTVKVGTYTARLVKDGTVVKEETVNIDVSQIFFCSVIGMAEEVGSIPVEGASESLSESVGTV